MKYKILNNIDYVFNIVCLNIFILVLCIFVFMSYEYYNLGWNVYVYCIVYII